MVNHRISFPIFSSDYAYNKIKNSFFNTFEISIFNAVNILAENVQNNMKFMKIFAGVELYTFS